LFVERTVATYHFKAEGPVAVLLYKILKVIILCSHNSFSGDYVVKKTKILVYSSLVLGT